MKILAAILIWINTMLGLTKQNLIDPMRGYVVNVPEITITKFIELTPTPTRVIKKVVVAPTGVGYTGKWGVSQQIGADTWTMKVGEDPRMATPAEVLDALNTYRARYGSQKLIWNQKLADYAQSRAELFLKNGKTDEHAGFEDFLTNQDGYNKLGFDWLGENISYGFKLEGVHLIEWMYAGDKPHDDNQKNPRWDHVGIGVAGTATSIIFATSPR